MHFPPCFCCKGTVPVPHTLVGKLLFTCCLEHSFSATEVESLQNGRQGSVSFPDCIVEFSVRTSLWGQGTQDGARSHEGKEWTKQMLSAMLFTQAPSHQVPLGRLSFLLHQCDLEGKLRTSQHISSNSVLSKRSKR